MGKIYTKIVITNRADQILAEAGHLSPEQIRSVTLNRVLADTGATTLCLPTEIVTQLGLKLMREVDVLTATGLSKARVFEDAKLSLYERQGTFECVELPSGTEPLLGVIPMEALGLELNMQTQEIRLLPMGPVQTYITIL
jgi:predicted aspartyl protease